MVTNNTIEFKLTISEGASKDYLEEEYVDLDWSEEMSTTEKSVTTTSKATRSFQKRKRIFDEKEVEDELEGSGVKAGHFIGDDEDLEAADVDGSAEGSGFDSADLGKAFLFFFLNIFFILLLCKIFIQQIPYHLIYHCENRNNFWEKQIIFDFAPLLKSNAASLRSSLDLMMGYQKS